MSAESRGALSLVAPAKINLYLHVTGRRDDGYHLLDSLIIFIDLADELSLRPADRLTLSLGGKFADRAGDPEDNLVLRAARLLAAEAGVEAGMAASLVKNIPAAAGLGGGSADAAAALQGLMRLWGIPDNAVDLPALALQIGADVPVCLVGRASFIGGIGELIAPAPRLPQAGLLLVNPGVALATPSVFARRRGGFSPPARFADAPSDVAELAALLADRDNDLAEPAIALAPIVADVLSALDDAPGCRLARMTGSGATCFGLFDDEEAARHAADRLRREGWWVRPTAIRA